MRDFFTSFEDFPLILFSLHFAVLLTLLLGLRYGILKRTYERKNPGLKLLHRIAEKTWPLVLAVTAFHLALKDHEIPKTLRRYEEIAFWAMAGLQFYFWLNIIIDFFVHRIARNRSNGHNYQQILLTSTPVRIIIQILVGALIIIMVLDTLGVNVTGLIAGLGVGGIALALAVQNILKDLLSSLSIALDKPFVEGDFVVFGDKMGTIEKIGLQTTRVRALSGEQLILNNNDILSSRIQNFKRMETRRIEFRFSATYQTPRDKVGAIPGMIKEIIQTIPKTRLDRAHFKEFGDAGLVFEAVYFVMDPDFNLYMDIQQAINLELMKRFEDLDIQFATQVQAMQILQPGKGARPGSPTPDFD